MLLQGIKPGILAGIVKGFKSGKAEQTTDATPTPQSNFSHLENIFSKPPFSDSSPAVTDSQEAVELNIGFSASIFTVFSCVAYSFSDCFSKVQMILR